VTVPHVQIDCLTAEGTGKDHAWELTIGGQSSGKFTTVLTS